MRRLFVSLGILVSIIALLMTAAPIAAQSDEQCSGAVSSWDEDAVQPLLQAYSEIAEDASDIDTLATLQALRREFEDQDAPGSAIEVKALLIRMVNLRSDAIVATLTGDQDLAERLLRDSERARDDALEMFSEVCPQAVVDVQMTVPANGDTVTHQTFVEGTYDQDLLGDNQLWVILFAPNNQFFPQVALDADCSVDSARSVVYGPRPGTWRVTAYVGGEGPEFSGQQYDIILFAADPAEHEAMIDTMVDWCEEQSFPGLADVTSAPYGFEFITSVRVTRE